MLRHHTHYFLQMLLHLRKVGTGLTRVFIQIDTAVDLNLQAMALVLGLPNAANQRHALLRVVVGHAIALALQRLANQADKGRVTGGDITVPQHKDRQLALGLTQTHKDIAGHGV